MHDLNCPSCGTTKNSVTPGFCDCCGFEFSEKYINDFLSENEKKEIEIKKKISLEEKRLRILQKEEKREKQEKVKNEKKGIAVEKKRVLKEREEREKLIKLINNDEKRYSDELKFSQAFEHFRIVVSKIAVVLIVISIISSLAFADKLNVSFKNPQKSVETKIHFVYEDMVVPYKYDKKINGKKVKKNIKLPKGTAKFLKSISHITKKQSSFEDKISFVFPLSEDLIKKASKNKK